MDERVLITTHRSHWPAAMLLAGALALATAALLPPASATAAPTQARDSILGWTLSEQFPNVRAFPESFSSLAFPNRCLFISVLPCP